MKKFNICYGQDIRIDNFTVPHGAVYGKDSAGKWVCTRKTPKTLFGHMTLLALWRQGENGYWYISYESGKTARFIIQKMQDTHTTADEMPVCVDYAIRERRQNIQREKRQQEYERRKQARIQEREQTRLEWEQARKFAGLHQIALSAPNDVIRKHRIKIGGYANRQYERRNDYLQKPLDLIEMSMCGMRPYQRP